MMPTFPSSPLRFRTVGFPQYGSKVNMSSRACPKECQLKPVPGIRVHSRGLLHSSQWVPRQETRFRVQIDSGFPLPLCKRLHLFTPGALGSGKSYVVSSPHRLLRPHAPVPRARHDFAVLPLIRNAFAVRERLSDPRDLPYFYCRAFHACRRPYSGGPRCPPVSTCTSVPGFLLKSGSRHLQNPSLPAIPDGVIDFGAASFTLCCGLYVCLALQAGYNAMKSYVLHHAFSGRCHSRFSRHPLPATAGSQARWAYGKPPIIGTFTRQVTAASEAARLHGLRGFCLMTLLVHVGSRDSFMCFCADFP
jgi:hypothetical protein